MRRNIRGKAKSVNIGWGSPAQVRGLSNEGIRQVVVATVAALSKINKEEEHAVISATVGQRTKVALVEAAQQQGIAIANIKDAQAYLKMVSEVMAKKQATKAKKKESKEEKKKKLEKKVEEQKKSEDKKEGDVLADKIAEEEEKKEAKKKQDKVLTKKDAL